MAKGAAKDVNPEVTDATTEGAVKVAGSASQLALGSLYAATALAMQHAAENARYAQQQNNLAAAAATNAGIRILNAILPAPAPAPTPGLSDDSGRKDGQ